MFTPEILRVLAADPSATHWESDFTRVLENDASLTRNDAREESVRALQRALLFLGYSTTGRGAFVVDGDFGPGTNRGLAQFAFDHALANAPTRDQLCYPCVFSNAHRLIHNVPEVRVTRPVIEALESTLSERIESNRVLLGEFDSAIWHLNQLDARRGLTCRQILERYGPTVRSACTNFASERPILATWVLALIRQESAGIIRPRFEQHKFSGFADGSMVDLRAIRYRSMSIGLGQVMGYHFEMVGATSAEAMLLSPIEDQIGHILHYLDTARGQTRRDLSGGAPSEEAFRRIARFYNGPAYRTHRYDETLAGYFREFATLAAES